MDLLDEDCDDLVRVEGRAPRQHLIDHRGDRVDVSLGTDLLALRRLRRDVARGAEDEARRRRDGLFAPVEARDAEVEHLDEVGIVGAVDEHDVLGLETVSYTHLDVYKRQGRDRDLYATLQFAGAKQAEFPSALLRHIPHGNEDRTRFHDVKAPVSYTHLDVYKRQRLW